MKLPKLPKIGRYAVCILLLVAVFAAYEVRLFQWQIVDGEMYQEISLSDRTDTIELSAARGQILDRNGEVLAGNRTTYSIVYNALYMDYDQRNVTILQVIDLLEERGEAWRDRLPITIDETGRRSTLIPSFRSSLRYGCNGISSSLQIVSRLKLPRIFCSRCWLS